jgi:hypothetical protein
MKRGSIPRLVTKALADGLGAGFPKPGRGGSNPPGRTNRAAGGTADAPVSKAGAFGCEGANPSPRTNCAAARGLIWPAF